MLPHNKYNTTNKVRQMDCTGKALSNCNHLLICSEQFFENNRKKKKITFVLSLNDSIN